MTTQVRDDIVVAGVGAGYWPSVGKLRDNPLGRLILVLVLAFVSREFSVGEFFGACVSSMRWGGTTYVHQEA